jgi:cellulose synthase/poly-beta-1,6-N-acetylglucosamine synthase-like glycosyltransferase
MIFFSVLFYLLALSGIFLKYEKRKTTKKHEWPLVTVQIPTFNEPVAIRCAKKCLEFDYPKEKLEIIIGDDSNDERVSRLIDDFAKKHPDRIKVTRRGSNVGFKAGNLNHMLKHSNGEIIVIFDSDFVPPKNFLKKVIPPFLEDEKVGCVQVKWKFMNMEQNRVSKLASSVLAVYNHILAVINSKHGVSLLFGSGQAVRKDILIELGGWQEGSLTEDVEFSLRTLKKGYKTIYLPDFRVPGEVPFTIKGFFKQQKRWAYGNAKAFLQHAKWILFGDKLSFLQKSLLTFTLMGYLSAPFLVLFTLFGIVSFMTGEPARIDFIKFFKETGWMFFVNSGFIAAALVALSKEKKLGMALSVLASSVTVGFIASVGITQGLINAFLGRKMSWSMIKKRGNEKLSWLKS